VTRPASPAKPLSGLAPVIDERARVLILGSFPSPASLAAQQYYAHRQNQFWRILAEIVGRPLPALDYPARLDAVRAAGIAIWDVYGGCTRDGSLDSAIRDAQANDFHRLKEIAPRLRRACFNGKTAGRFAPAAVALGLESAILPSTSPAYTLAFAAKLAAWRTALAA
jgi:TDG/mug DNA glycosylase family protein